MSKKRLPEQTWQNRIVSHGEQPANQFLAHELNARRHPHSQRSVLRGSLDQVGWIEPVIVSHKSGKLLDGHARIEEALSSNEHTLVPFITVEVSDEEERIILATKDKITNLAEFDQDATLLLLDGLQADNQALDALLDQMKAETEPVAATESDGRKGLTKSRNAVVKLVVSVKEAGLIEQAIKASHIVNRGEALQDICRTYLNEKGQFDI